jgi:hypothetical protein
VCHGSQDLAIKGAFLNPMKSSLDEQKILASLGLVDVKFSLYNLALDLTRHAQVAIGVVHVMQDSYNTR